MTRAHVIGSSVAVRGAVRGTGDVVVRGVVEGSLEVDGAVTVEPGARLDAVEGAVVSAASVLLEGSASGVIDATQRVTLGPEARVEGSLRAPSVVIAAGARFRGYIETTGTWSESGTHAPVGAPPSSPTTADVELEGRGAAADPEPASGTDAGRPGDETETLAAPLGQADAADLEQASPPEADESAPTLVMSPPRDILAAAGASDANAEVGARAADRGRSTTGKRR